MNNDNNTNDSHQQDSVIDANIETVFEQNSKVGSLEQSPEEPIPRYAEGQLLTFIKVRFPGNAKSFSFLIGKRKLSYGQKVVAMSDRGMAVGYINSFPFQLSYTPELEPIRSISKVATDQDIQYQLEHYKREKEVETLCKKLIDKHKLEMNLTHVEFTQFGKKCVFYFTAPARVDFRDLVKDLVQDLKMRIELRQISVRDRAAAVGGIGPCGLQLCCSSFLGKYGQVSLKMAKNQDLSLASQRLNGVCGQLKCCLSHEDEAYTEMRQELPEVGSLIETMQGEFGRVEKIMILARQFDLITEQGIRKRYSFGEFKGPAPAQFKMPILEHINDETQTVIGLDQDLKNKQAKLQRDSEILQASAVQYAKDLFKNLFPENTFADETNKNEKNLK